jgi:hypothetical protein
MISENFKSEFADLYGRCNEYLSEKIHVCTLLGIELLKAGNGVIIYYECDDNINHDFVIVNFKELY